LPARKHSVSSHEIYPATMYGVDAVEHLGATSRRGYSPKYTALGKGYDDVIQIISRSGVHHAHAVVDGRIFFRRRSRSVHFRNPAVQYVSRVFSRRGQGDGQGDGDRFAARNTRTAARP